MRILLLLLITVYAPYAYAQTKSNVEVIIFLGSECPISQKYVNTLNQIYLAYQNKGVKFTALFPEKVDIKIIDAFTSELGVKFPCLLDKRMRKARQLEASITPEVFVLKQGNVMYQGAIDDWFYELGKYRKEVTQPYLKNALDAVLNNEMVEVKKTEALGCFIQM
jgi:thiol-disulfide isomerase/thioredoxin